MRSLLTFVPIHHSFAQPCLLCLDLVQICLSISFIPLCLCFESLAMLRSIFWKTLYVQITGRIAHTHTYLPRKQDKNLQVLFIRRIEAEPRTM
jgi:hypothetical protein